MKGLFQAAGPEKQKKDELDEGSNYNLFITQRMQHIK